MCSCTRTDFVHVGTYVTKVQSFSEYHQSWVHACLASNCIVGLEFSAVGSFPSPAPQTYPPLSELKPLFHTNLCIVSLSKHFLFSSHFVIQTILGIIALRNKVCVMIKAPLLKSYTFAFCPSNWRLWKAICWQKKKKKKNHQTYQNLHNYRTRHLRLKSLRLEDDKAESCHQYRNCKPVSCSPVQQDLCSPISSPTAHSATGAQQIQNSVQI